MFHQSLASSYSCVSKLTVNSLQPSLVYVDVKALLTEWNTHVGGVVQTHRPAVGYMAGRFTFFPRVKIVFLNIKTASYFYQTTIIRKQIQYRDDAESLSGKVEPGEA